VASAIFQTWRAWRFELRYGERYEFRVRLADATGGGPTLADQHVQEGEAPTAIFHMKRHVPPRRPVIDATPNPAPDDGAVFAGTGEFKNIATSLLSRVCLPSLPGCGGFVLI